MRSFLLDTCTAIWIAENKPLREPAVSTLGSTVVGKFYVSPMTAWEIAMLVAKGKIALSIKPLVWFQLLTTSPDIVQAELPVSVLISSTTLPDIKINDPVDRILIATAREFGFTLVTRDKSILEYGSLGHVSVLGC